ncbi:hypothetical protein V5O48_003973 [Marasmius crinis-equi]|uniref:Chalcone isomerase domain-containing protein n=1 Tax=Marasmius crinis-equi TaxID=585013 RepID=A0ABR3FRD7_9AGAR
MFPVLTNNSKLLTRSVVRNVKPFRIHGSHQKIHTLVTRRQAISRFKPLVLGVGLLLGASLIVRPSIHLDAVTELPSKTEDGQETVVDPATGIAFPKIMRVPAQLDPSMTPEQKIEEIVKKGACVIRIVPTRNTSYSHLRDAFMRAMYARLGQSRKLGTLSEDEATEIAFPLRKLKTLFPNTALSKNTPFDIFLSEPASGKPRSLIFRDLGAIEHDWVATEFVLNYFEGDGPSPPVKLVLNIFSQCDLLNVNADESLQNDVYSHHFGHSRDMGAYNYLTAEDVDHFLERGYIVVKNAFSREKAAQWTETMWIRLGLDPSDRTTWDRERIHMPFHEREEVARFSPKAWQAITDLLGGEDRIDEKSSSWGDSFIVNFGTPELENAAPIHPRELDNWHVDGDFFVHYLDSPEQALLVVPIFSDINPAGGGTYISPDGIDIVANYLAAHPEGVLPAGRAFVPSTTNTTDYQDDPDYISLLDTAQKCNLFVELTGEIGDVVLLHPLMLHSASKNHLRIPRVITNPPVGLKEPFKFDRERPEDYSLVERKTLKALGKDRFDFRTTTERRKLVPKRAVDQAKVLEEEKQRLIAAGKAN